LGGSGKRGSEGKKIYVSPVNRVDPANQKRKEARSGISKKTLRMEGANSNSTFEVKPQSPTPRGSMGLTVLDGMRCSQTG